MSLGLELLQGAADVLVVEGDEDIVDASLEDASGAARLIVQAKTKAEPYVGAALIETTVVSAGLPSVRPTQLVLGSGGELRSAYFVTLDADPFLHPGSIVHLDGPVASVTGFVCTRAITYDWKRVGDAEVHKLIVRGDFARG